MENFIKQAEKEFDELELYDNTHFTEPEEENDKIRKDFLSKKLQEAYELGRKRTPI